ncbi:MAG: hypothetical protein WAM97_04090 [Acidimicrobiales bacterium]
MARDRGGYLSGLTLLERRGILTPLSGPTGKRGRAEHWWKAQDMFELLGG